MKEFGNFDPKVIAVIIRGAISGSKLATKDEFTLRDYTEKVIKSIMKMVN
ncbi:hypothetical protein [Gracilibacillus dipsosauri]